jgi:aspartyl-tRNA(Asn)/glutamyl-tRNA(Gln) amidotransferase subunit B
MKENKLKIGLEIHVQLNTKSKLFCSCTTSAEQPNTSTCDVCLGMPGSKPVVNKKAAEFAVKLGLALNCAISRDCFFSRKTYFYPDMAKNYQITQYEKPVASNGNLMVGKNKITIRRLQLEEDPAATKYPQGIKFSDYILIDYNRAGIPLVEIVTEPDFSSPEEARAFLEILQAILEYIGVFDSRNGTIRVDANISVAPHPRVEIKNITGFREVENALRFEITRQEDHNKRGEAKKTIETRLYDPATKSTELMRTKETEEEYGYIFDPDLVKLEFAADFVKKLRAGLPELPQKKAERFAKQYRITEDESDSIVTELELAETFEKLARIDAQLAARWISVYLKKVLNFNSLRFRDTKLTADHLASFLKLLKSEEISQRGGELLLRELVLKPQDSHKLAEKMNLLQLKDADLGKVVKKVIAANSAAVKDYKSGEKKALQFLVGQVIRETKGRADAKSVLELLKKHMKL